MKPCLELKPNLFRLWSMYNVPTAIGPFMHFFHLLLPLQIILEPNSYFFCKFLEIIECQIMFLDQLTKLYKSSWKVFVADSVTFEAMVKPSTYLHNFAIVFDAASLIITRKPNGPILVPWRSPLFNFVFSQIKFGYI